MDLGGDKKKIGAKIALFLCILRMDGRGWERKNEEWGRKTLVFPSKTVKKGPEKAKNHRKPAVFENDFVG